MFTEFKMAAPDNLIRVLQGLQHVCQKAAASLESVVNTWHSQKKPTLNPCTCTQHPICSAVNRKPKLGTFCAECVKWVTCIEPVYYPQPQPQPGKITKKPPIAWKNINSSLLYCSAIEVCNGFALNLPAGQKPTQILDYDTASILKIMMGFGEFHHNDQATVNFPSPYQAISQVLINLFSINLKSIIMPSSI